MKRFRVYWADLKAFFCADLSCSVEKSAKLNTEEAFPHLNSCCQEKLKPALPEEEALQIKTNRPKHGSQDKKRCPSFVKCCMKCQKEFLNWYVGRTTFVFKAPRQSDTALWSTVYHGSRCDRDDTYLIQSSHVRVSIEWAPLNVNSVDTQGAFKTPSSGLCVRHTRSHCGPPKCTCQTHFEVLSNLAKEPVSTSAAPLHSG